MGANVFEVVPNERVADLYRQAAKAYGLLAEVVSTPRRLTRAQAKELLSKLAELRKLMDEGPLLKHWLRPLPGVPLSKLKTSERIVGPLDGEIPF